MRLLALDTATFVASVAVWKDGAIVAAGDAHADTHSEKLLPLVDALLRQAGLAPADLDGVACGAGPGSFTGLRIGLATAKGLGFALGKPLVLVSSLAALAAGGVDFGQPVLAMLDAKKREVYAGLFAPDLTPIGAEVVLPPAKLAEHARALAAGRELVVVGDGAAAYPEVAAACGRVLEGARRTPDARAIAALAARRLAAGETDNLAVAAPTYIRASEAEIAVPPVEPFRRRT
jgi:tRNA threonylcarbamoyladenosine biosynthesis protein TsaB